MKKLTISVVPQVRGFFRARPAAATRGQTKYG